MGASTGRQRMRRTAATSVPTAAIAGIAVVASAILGVTPTLSTAPWVLTDSPAAYWVPGAKTVTGPPDSAYESFADAVLDNTAGAHQPITKVDYAAAIWPTTKGLFFDATFNVSVRDGVTALRTATGSQGGNIIYANSLGAVVATEYMREAGVQGNTYVLVGNPNRPNGGIMQRFNGATIPILDLSFTGATPTDGDVTYDIARQYDGWTDFPKYPLNLLATVNALLGIAFLHGKYPEVIDPAALDDSPNVDKQVWNNTTYYLVHTDRLPLLMPFGFLPKPLLDALDAPLRVLIELGYDRSNYGKPTGAGWIPSVNPVDIAHDVVDSTAKSITAETAPPATEEKDGDESAKTAARHGVAESAAAEKPEAVSQDDGTDETPEPSELADPPADSPADTKTDIKAEIKSEAETPDKPGTTEPSGDTAAGNGADRDSAGTGTGSETAP